ncbi:GapA-binding peptide SR1P [Bacillus canaveralius]|uniref:GapA-binding peptide SR1P n=1 Tax=Bacillus canaveralius TaxID=1403243 RepID=A0A2N5GL86_9BACI|nr:MULTISPECIES: GapA-binding peptide SR1P [Bacillus]PLR81281.1 GapA-binding peptide SR1P [Bacillus sp. V33-4]PLR82326.1 GapA-binding peptide SR1P [Bacillus canaveralius]PLR99437.1 GapA-binding peptide SR1P [Bacillus canaveralius]RSK49125.1 GapA-binding peptide SR1P [Bacillus canaveralius]
MGTIVCRHCDSIIEHFEDEKVIVQYSECVRCSEDMTDEHDH